MTKIVSAEGSVQPKLGFGIGNRNQDQVSVSVSGPELFLPKPKLSPILKIYQNISAKHFWRKNIKEGKMEESFGLGKKSSGTETDTET